MNDLEKRLQSAVKHFWKTRGLQKKKRQAKAGLDEGGRGAAVGGGQMDGFVDLLADDLLKLGVPRDCLYRKNRVELPGYFRATKEWDLIAVMDGHLLAALEFKSQVGSFGNNYNNRTEEALGNATDIWTAFREGAFKQTRRPWVGYLMLLQEAPGSTAPVGVEEPHFRVFPEFRDASYARRYEILCRKLVRERLYDASCLILSKEEHGLEGQHSEPAADIWFQPFMESLRGHVMAFLATRRHG